MTDFFVDPTLATHGDGSAPTEAGSAGAAGALNTLAGITPAAGDRYWIRRDDTGDALTADLDIAVERFQLVGWPLVGDELYSERPGAAKALWDGDAATHAKITFSSSLRIDFLAGSSEFALRRLQVRNSHTSPGVSLNSAVKGGVFERYIFDTDSYATDRQAINQVGDAYTFIDCEFRGSRDTSSNAGIVEINGDNNVFTRPVFDFGRIEDTTDGIGLEVPGSDNSFIDADISIRADDASSNSAIDISGERNRFLGLNYDDANLENGKGNINVQGHANIVDADLNDSGPRSLTIGGDSNRIALKNVQLYDPNGLVMQGNSNLVDIDGCNLAGATGFNIAGADCVLLLKDYTFVDNAWNITGRGSVVYSLNHGGVAGVWEGANEAGVMRSTLVKRTGGADVGIYCRREAAELLETPLPQLGVAGLAEWQRIGMIAGSKRITLFAASKLFDGPLRSENLVLEIEYEDANGRPRQVTSLEAGGLVTDASVWENESGLTSWAVYLDVVLPADQTVPVRVRGRLPESAAGYIILDPIVVVSDTPS
ncbi:MAG: hypothetical protein AAF676_06570 [Pseudomonadota bacterium]